MRCSSCGSENFEGAAFCSLCLQPLASDPAAVAGPGGAPAPPEPSVVAPSSFAEPSAAAPSGPAVAPDLAAGPYGAAAPPPPEWLAAGYPPAAQEDPLAYADVVLRAERTEARVPMLFRSVDRAPGLAWTKWINRYTISAAFLLGGILIWILTGGIGKMKAAESAKLPVPKGSELVGTIREMTVGPAGPLNEERQGVFATRVFLVPLAYGQAVDYYRSGEGSRSLSAEGWRVHRQLADSERWHAVEYVRMVTVGYPMSENQRLVLEIGEGATSGGLSQAALAKLVKGQNAFVRMQCLGTALKRTEYPPR